MTARTKMETLAVPVLRIAEIFETLMRLMEVMETMKPVLIMMICLFLPACKHVCVEQALKVCKSKELSFGGKG